MHPNPQPLSLGEKGGNYPEHPTHLAGWLDFIGRQTLSGIHLGLARVAEVWQRLQPGKLPLILTFAGTNGKGSSVAFAEAILQAAGYSTGAYTSPHLYAFEERLRFNGQISTDSQWCQAFAAVNAARGDVPLSYFEFTTLAAFYALSQQSVDVWLMEVGLGGRLDVVNLLDADGVVITTIDYDHGDYLGTELEQIAREKAGVLRSGQVAILSDTSAPRVIDQIALQLPCDFYRAGQDFIAQICPENHQAWCFSSPFVQLDGLPLPSQPGAFQLQNAAGVVALLCRLPQVSINKADIVQGLMSARVQGRLETLSHASGAQILLDVAHNPQSMQALAEYVADHLPGGKLWVLWSALGDKDLLAMLKPWQRLPAQWLVVPLSVPRAASTAQLTEAVESLQQRVQILADFHQAWQCLETALRPSDLLVICGSFHVLDAVHGFLAD